MYNDDYLMHYGIKGMKWGVRRYQNADGTYTESGKKRNFKKIEKAYLNDIKTGYEDRNSGKTYRDLANKNPDIAKALEPAIKSEQKYYRAWEKDNKLIRKEYDKLVKDYAKKHGKQPDNEEEHILGNEAYYKVGTPNSDALHDEWINTGRKTVDNVLGKYGSKRLNTFNQTFGGSVLNGYITIEAQLRNKEEDRRNKI